MGHLQVNLANFKSSGSQKDHLTKSAYDVASKCACPFEAPKYMHAKDRLKALSTIWPASMPCLINDQFET